MPQSQTTPSGTAKRTETNYRDDDPD